MRVKCETSRRISSLSAGTSQPSLSLALSLYLSLSLSLSLSLCVCSCVCVCERERVEPPCASPPCRSAPPQPAQPARSAPACFHGNTSSQRTPGFRICVERYPLHRLRTWSSIGHLSLPAPRNQRVLRQPASGFRVEG